MLPVEMVCMVTPLAGVWIEITGELNISRRILVTPLAGVWIEIMKQPPEIVKS